MAEKADVRSIDALAFFRGQVIGTSESIRRLLDDCNSQVRRVQQWLEGECAQYWKREARKRDQKLNTALSDLQRARIAQPDADIRSFVDHNRAIRKAKAKLEEAAEKSRLIRQWVIKMDREAMILRGQLQRIGHMAEYDLPAGARWLAALESHLQGYTQDAPQIPVPDQIDGPPQQDAGRGGTQREPEEERQ
jgi:uncharacterized protein YukE